MSVKYKIQFQDKLGAECSVSFDFASYTGTSVMQLIASATPCTITWDGDQTDLFQPVITSKANIQVLINQTSQSFVQDVRDIDDKEVFVTILYNGKKWIGYLIADENYEKFDKTGYFMSLTVCDPFSYLKQDTQTILSKTTMFGMQTIYDFIQAIMNESVPNIPIKLINNYIPNYDGATDILKSSYIYVETFMQDNVFPDGYTIMQNLMTSLGMTCFVSNGILYVINHRTNETKTPKEIGIAELGATDFLLNNSEIITRTRGVKRLSTEFDYPDPVNQVKNGQFYYYDAAQNKGSEFLNWDYDTTQLTDGSFTRTGFGTDDNSFGVKVSGEWALSGTGDLNTAQLVNQFTIKPSDFFNSSPLVLSIDFTYLPYITSTSAKIRWGIIIEAQAVGQDDVYGYVYSGDGGATVNGAWTENETNSPILFNLPSSTQKNNFILGFDIGGAGFPVAWNSIPVTFSVKIIGILPSFNTDYITDNPTNPINYNIIVNNVFIGYNKPNSIDTNSYDVAQAYSYSKDTTYIINSRNYSLVQDSVKLFLGNKYFQYVIVDTWELEQFVFDSGIIMQSNGSAIPSFLFGSTTIDKLVNMIAKDRMYFGRQPRYQIDCEIQSNNLDFSDLVTFKEGENEIVPGVYTLMSDEYDLKNCKHHIVCQQLTGYDDANDVTENYLS